MKISLGFLHILTLLFVYLKLTHQIDWSWWLVVAPLLWPLYIVLVIFVVAFLISLWEVR